MSVRGYERKAGDFARATNQQELFDYLESLNRQDWADMLIDLMLEPARVARLILTDPGEELVVRFATHVRHLGATTKRLVEDAIETVFSDARSRLRGEQQNEVYRFGFFLMTSMGTGSRVALAKPLMLDRGLPDDVRIMAAAAVAEDATASAGMWESLDLRAADAVLAPTAITALAEWDPEAALRLLGECPLSHPEDIEYPVEIAVRALLKRENGFELLGAIAGGLPTSAQNIVGASPSFRKLAWNQPFSKHQLGMLEGALGVHFGTLTQVIVVAARIDEPDNRLRESVRANFNRGVQYIFIVPEARYEIDKAKWFNVFHFIAQEVVDTQLQPPQKTEDLIDILPLPDDWDDAPYIFYRLSVDGNRKYEVFAVRGNTKNVGIAERYSAVPQEYAAAIARTTITSAKINLATGKFTQKEPKFLPTSLETDEFKSNLLDEFTAGIPEWNKEGIQRPAKRDLH